MLTTATPPGVVCEGVRLARERAAAEPPMPFASLQATIRVGSFLLALPPTSREAVHTTAAMLDMALQSGPAWVDDPPRVETAHGAVPVLLLERCPWLERLDVAAGAGDREATGLMCAAVALDEHLVWIERTWEAVRRRLWATLGEVEAVAGDLLAAHLASNLLTARRERERYLYPGPERLPRVDAIKDLGRSLAVVAAARRSADVDAVKTEEWVVLGVSLALTVVAVGGAVGRGEVLLDAQAWREINAATGLADEARAHTVEALTTYLRVLRREAAQHPLVLVLERRGLGSANVLEVAREVDVAVQDAEAAIGTILSDGINVLTIPDGRRAQDLTPSGLAGRLASAGRLSVWKLPFFVEAALGELPPERGSEVLALMELAAEQAGGEAIGHALALFGIDTAMMFASKAGPVGIGLALAWALLNLGKSIVEYQQLSALYRATIDPAILLRGMDHEQASKLGIILDLFGLLVV